VGRDVFSQTNVRPVIILTVIFGLTHSLLWTAFAYSNAVSGMRPPVLDEFAKGIIIQTAIVEFITGSLIGLISVILVKYFSKPNRWEFNRI
jgi:hypothetical protein